MDTLTSIELRYTHMLSANGERKPVMHGYKGAKVAQWVSRSQAIEDVYLDISQPAWCRVIIQAESLLRTKAPATVEDGGLPNMRTFGI